MAPRPIELDREDVLKVAAKVAEVASPPSRRKVAKAFGISQQTLTAVAERGGWLEDLDEALAVAKGPRPLDEALAEVAKLVG